MNGKLMIIGKVKNGVSLVYAKKTLLARFNLSYYDEQHKYGEVELVAYNKMAKQVAVICKENVVVYIEASLKPVEFGKALANELNITHIELLYEGYKPVKRNLDFLKELDPLAYLGKAKKK